MRYGLFILICLLGIAFICENAYSQSDAWAEINIEPLRNIGSANIKVTFGRERTVEKQMIVTAIKMAGHGSSNIVEPIELIHIENHGAHLTGWFVIKEKVRELWLGTQFDIASPSEFLTIRIPGVLRELEGVDTRYELVIDNPDMTVRSFTNSSPNFLFARIKELSVNVPKWLQVIKSDGWIRETGDTTMLYKLDDKWGKSGARVLEFKRTDLLADWLDQSLAKFFAGFISSVIVVLLLVDLAGGIKTSIRVIIYSILLILLIGMYGIGGWQAFRWRRLAFSGAPFLGFTIGFIILGLLPDKSFPRIRDVYKKWKES